MLSNTHLSLTDVYGVGSSGVHAIVIAIVVTVICDLDLGRGALSDDDRRRHWNRT